MTLAELLEDIRAEMPEERLKAVDALLEKFGGSDTFRLTLTLLAATDSRERRLSKMLINDLDLQEIE